MNLVALLTFLFFCQSKLFITVAFIITIALLLSTLSPFGFVLLVLMAIGFGLFKYLVELNE